MVLLRLCRTYSCHFDLLKNAVCCSKVNKNHFLIREHIPNENCAKQDGCFSTITITTHYPPPPQKTTKRTPLRSWVETTSPVHMSFQKCFRKSLNLSQYVHIEYNQTTPSRMMPLVLFFFFSFSIQAAICDYNCTFNLLFGIVLIWWLTLCAHGLTIVKITLGLVRAGLGYVRTRFRVRITFWWGLNRVSSFRTRLRNS